MNITKRVTMGESVLLPNGKPSNFQWWELVQTDQPYPNIPDEKEEKNLILLVTKILQPVRDIFGPVELTSAFRSELVNRAVGGKPTSQHRKGLAADIIRTGKTSLYDAFEKIRKSSIPYDQLIYETGTKENPDAIWIHISYNPKGGRKQAILSPYNYEKNTRDYQLVT